jgi:hypothetical protein
MFNIDIGHTATRRGRHVLANPDFRKNPKTIAKLFNGGITGALMSSPGGDSGATQSPSQTPPLGRLELTGHRLRRMSGAAIQSLTRSSSFSLLPRTLPPLPPLFLTSFSSLDTDLPRPDPEVPSFRSLLECRLLVAQQHHLPYTVACRPRWALHAVHTL